MPNRAYRLPSTPDLFLKEFRNLKLKHPEKCNNSILSSFNHSFAQHHDQTESTVAKPGSHYGTQ